MIWPHCAPLPIVYCQANLYVSSIYDYTCITVSAAAGTSSMPVIYDRNSSTAVIITLVRLEAVEAAWRPWSSGVVFSQILHFSLPSPNKRSNESRRL